MGITLDELIFDPSNPDDGANVGATLRGSDGTVIGNVGDRLKVDIDEIDIDIRDLNASQDNVAISDGTETLLINPDGSLNSVVTATDLDIRDLAFATDSVDVSGSSVTVSATDLDIRDLSFATDKVDASGSEVNQNAYDTFLATAQSVTATASELASTPLTSRVRMNIQNLGNKEIYIGQSNAVTISTGTKIPAGGSADFQFGENADIWALTPSGTADVRILEFAY